MDHSLCGHIAFREFHSDFYARAMLHSDIFPRRAISTLPGKRRGGGFSHSAINMMENLKYFSRRLLQNTNDMARIHSHHSQRQRQARYSTDRSYFSAYFHQMAVRQIVETSLFLSRDNQEGQGGG